MTKILRKRKIKSTGSPNMSCGVTIKCLMLLFKNWLELWLPDKVRVISRPLAIPIVQKRKWAKALQEPKAFQEGEMVLGEKEENSIFFTAIPPLS